VDQGLSDRRESTEEEKMLIVGERINTSRKGVNEAVERRDVAYIQADVKAQVEAGADIIDVNAGSRSASELDDLRWLISVIEEAVPARLSLDSSNPDVLAAVVNTVRDMPMLNSTTVEKTRFDKMALVIKERECDVVALCIDDRGVPKTSGQILENATKLVKGLEAIGVKRERIHLDPLVQAVSVDNKAALAFLDAIEMINRELPGVKTVCGLSNVSFSLPKRPLVNRTFLALAMRAGLQGALIDPLDKKLMATLRATMVLLGQDPFCRTYLKAFRAGRLED
jgi:5-methyltetrahydrofolate--homocysteine methyltransferase